MAAPFHIVVTEQRLLLVRAPDLDWQALQARFADFKTSMGPLDLEAALDYAFEEWPELAWAEAAARAFAASEAACFDLERGAVTPS